MRNTEIIGSSDLLGALPEASLHALADGGRVRSVEKGTMLFLQGDHGAHIFILAQGSIRLFQVGSGGREAVLHLVRPGELFAEVVLFESDTYPACAEARENSTVLAIPTAHVHRLLEESTFRRHFMATLMRKIRFLGRHVYVLSSCDVRERLFRFLEGRYGRSTEYTTELSKREVAAAIATTPETLSRVLARLQDEQMLSWEGAHIRVSDAMWDLGRPDDT